MDLWSLERIQGKGCQYSNLIRPNPHWNHDWYRGGPNSKPKSGWNSEDSTSYADNPTFGLPDQHLRRKYMQLEKRTLDTSNKDISITTSKKDSGTIPCQFSLILYENASSINRDYYMKSACDYVQILMRRSDKSQDRKDIPRIVILRIILSILWRDRIVIVYLWPILIRRRMKSVHRRGGKEKGSETQHFIGRNSNSDENLAIWLVISSSAWSRITPKWQMCTRFL